VQLTIDTGHLLGATITAEGVETAEQHRQLVSMGTDHLQGFGLARPMPASQLPLWLSESLDPIQSELST
jgi:EAL domain-containing protein (putative c-di-GMP-specific phosphodiesterase class I)